MYHFQGCSVFVFLEKSSVEQFPFLIETASYAHVDQGRRTGIHVLEVFSKQCSFFTSVDLIAETTRLPF